MTAILLGVLLALTVTSSFADPPMGEFYGVRIETSSGTITGYVDKMCIRELARDRFEHSPRKQYSDNDIVSLLAKQPRLAFYSGLDTIEINIERPLIVRNGRKLQPKPHHRTITVSTGMNGQEILAKDIRKIERSPGKEDGRPVWAILSVSPHELKLFKTLKPNYICRDENSEAKDNYWASFNPAIGEDSLRPLCERKTKDQLPANDQKSSLENKDVFLLEVSGD